MVILTRIVPGSAAESAGLRVHDRVYTVDGESFANGTEFGGAATEIPGVYLSSGPSASVQLVWYW